MDSKPPLRSASPVFFPPDALEELKGARRAGEQNQPQGAAVSHLPSLASSILSMGDPWQGKESY